MSRFAPPLTRPGRRHARDHGALVAWHSSCISLAVVALSGCFSPWTIVEEDINKPPELRASSPEVGEPFVLDLPEKTAFVFVRDANDPLDLEFRWTIQGFGVQGGAVPIQGNNEQGSQLVVPRNDDFDDRVLSVRVTDGFGDALTLEWLIEIPEVQR